MADSTGRCLPVLTAAASNWAELKLLISFTNALHHWQLSCNCSGAECLMPGLNRQLLLSLSMLVSRAIVQSKLFLRSSKPT